MAVSVALEITCVECGTSVPRNEVRYLVLWNRERREYFPAAFGRNCCLKTAQWKNRPLGRNRPIPVFPRRRAAQVHAEKLNAKLRWRPVPMTDPMAEPEQLPVVLGEPKNTWSDLDR
ncbi:MAG: hypothetical protein HYV55_00815 [Parcubacteria group bacterium]|nr:hypothetical protein [Parcubacteria group bacterium]